MTQDEEVRKLAELVAEIAARCWPQLGIETSDQVQREANAVAVSVSLRSKHSAPLGKAR